MHAKRFDTDRQGAHDVRISDTPKEHDPTPAMIDRLHREVVAKQAASHRASTIDDYYSTLALSVDQFSNEGVILETPDRLSATSKFRLTAKVTKNG